MFRSDLPDWVRDNMMMTCTYCGSVIMDNGDAGVTTSRWCSNKQCPGHMSHKMKFVADFFGVKNFGDKSALSYIRNNRCTNHLQILKEWFKESKPLVDLADVAVLACIEGYSETQARQSLNSYGTFSNYFLNCYSIPEVLLNNKEYLLECEQYFALKPPMSANKILVMATGSFNGFNSRDEFFRKINESFGQYIQVIQTGKRKTGVFCLLKEHGAVDHSKSQLAKECNIPIMTPTEFFQLLEATYISN